MNSTEEIFNILQNEVSHNLSGILLFDDAESIRWQLDGIVYGHSKADLEDLAIDDIDLLKEVLSDHNLEDSVEITQPEFDDVYVYFYIQEI
jgi:hypothetical protein